MDLLRAVAIILVLLAHTVLSFGAPESLAPLQLGGTGVDLFFVLSGWLLGGVLFREIEKTGKIDIKKFWIRRWMRTLPAYYAVLIFTVVQRYLTKTDVDFPWQYVFFLQNYDYPIEFFFVSWSLCVEEQFYLLIAPLILLLSLTNKRITTVCLTALLLVPWILRSLGWYTNEYETHVRIDCCIAGVLLAQISTQHRSAWEKLCKYSPQVASVGLVVYVALYVARYNPAWGLYTPDNLVLAIIFGSWVVIANASEYWSKIIYIPGAYHIATRSYAIYLLHPDVLSALERAPVSLPFPVYFAAALAGCLLAAEILYRAVEKPVMDSREMFAFSTSKSDSSRAPERTRDGRA
jgi:peptidoglycan/LPS O-acetylase OafA/YrhL